MRQLFGDAYPMSPENVRMANLGFLALETGWTIEQLENMPADHIEIIQACLEARTSLSKRPT